MNANFKYLGFGIFDGIYLEILISYLVQGINTIN